MCGIVGYIGSKQAAPILIEGLRKLEYRGYDSAGISVYNNGKITLTKCCGRLKNLEERLKAEPLEGTAGIGHTRWATHGEPSDINSHPHMSNDGTISVVHNGIIENYLYLKEWLQSEGFVFVTDTDTEVIPNLIKYYYNGDIVEAVMKAVSKMEGSYALGIMCEEEPDKILAVRKDSPLIVGLGEGENFIASDIPAILNHTRNIYLLNDREIAVLTSRGVSVITAEGRPVKKEVYNVTWDAQAAEKGGYEHFMIKEIHEQPKAIRDTLRSRISAVSDNIRLDDIKLTAEYLKGIKKIFVVACGTAYHASLVGKYAIEKLARIQVEADVASEFRYRNPIIDESTLMIVLSQSGETADTLAALREGKKKGARVIAVTNVVGSTVAREADDVFYTWAGPEIAVASTKAYITQLIAMYIIAMYFGRLNGNLSLDEFRDLKSDLLELPSKVQEILEQKEVVQKYAAKNYMHRDMYFFGRGLDYAVALEGSLKLKEISYIHADAYAGGELKHGPIALIEDGTPVIALATQESLFEKMLSNIKEVKARGAKVLAISLKNHNIIEKTADDVILLPSTAEIFTPVLSIVPLQLLAYYMAASKGCDIDKPRNLAKSVTVE